MRTVLRIAAGLGIAVCLISAGFVELAVAQDQSDEPAQADDLPGVSAVRVTSTPERARLIVDLEQTTQFAFLSLIDPMRIAIDVRANGYQGEPAAMLGPDSLISTYTIEQLDIERLRTLLTLSGPAQVQQAYMLEAFDDQPARFVIDLIADDEAAFVARAALAGHGAQVEGEALVVGARESPENIAQEVIIAQEDPASDSTDAESVMVPHAGQIDAATRPLILIDPGHGGVDGGAETSSGVLEKIITMSFATRLKEILIETGRFDVALTRDDDSFLRLEDRVALARENKATLFISIHADAFEDNDIRGASVYTRDERATDILDKVLAEQENRVDLLGGFAPATAEDAVVNILVDLMRREMRRQAFAAAEAIVGQLRPNIRVRRFPMRRADFFVLQSPDVPSILLELGFLSNQDDAENLTSPNWRDQAARNVALGIGSYFDGLGVP